MKAFLACVLSLLLSVIAFGQQAEPYTATVGDNQVPVRSAPFRDQYISAYLSAGDKVQVYRETKNGFLAIRPLNDSYSWVAGAYLELHADGEYASVRQSRVPSWIGSYDDRSVNYGYTVLLNKGEVVALLGQKEMALSRGSRPKTYYKISPPAGEFRWIHRQYLVGVSETQSRSLVDVVQQPGNHSEVALASYDDIPFDSQILTTTSPANYVPRWSKPSGRLKSGRLWERQPVVQSPPVQTRAETKTPFRQTSFPVQKLSRAGIMSVAELEFAISQMATQPSDLWDIGLLRDRANQLLSDSDAAEQGLIERIIERLNQYQQIKDERQRVEAIDNLNLPPRSSDLNIRNLPFSESDLDMAEVGSGVLTREARRTAYEETGYLVRVRASRNDAPEYAIVDAQGEVQVFVTPQPGLNLSTYLRRHVGVFGRRGYLYRLKTQHLTVTRIVDLDRHKN
ncbi:MAG: hypothetical protein CMJ76_15935 [Planctomycetaceae bacterium]|nr:hypothetical protein [Planctomycetaceae bacterium]